MKKASEERDGIGRAMESGKRKINNEVKVQQENNESISGGKGSLRISLKFWLEQGKKSNRWRKEVEVDKEGVGKKVGNTY